MNPSNFAVLNRRGFLKRSGLAAALTAGAVGQPKAVSIVAEPEDAIASSAPARWAIKTLQESLEARGFAVTRRQRITEASSSEICVLTAGAASTVAQGILTSAGVAVAAGPEGLSPARGR